MLVWYSAIFFMCILYIWLLTKKGFKSVQEVGKQTKNIICKKWELESGYLNNIINGLLFHPKISEWKSKIMIMIVIIISTLAT